MKIKLPTPAFVYSERSGFTLLEVLVVMAIIVTMAGLGATKFSGTESSNIRSGADIAYAVFGQARGEALQRNAVVRVLIDTDPAGVKNENYLQRMIVVFQDPENEKSWGACGPWTRFPQGVYYYKKQSQSHGEVNLKEIIPTMNPALCDYYEFSAQGLCATQARVVISPGRVGPSGEFKSKGINTCYGFVLHPLGQKSMIPTGSLKEQ